MLDSGSAIRVLGFALLTLAHLSLLSIVTNLTILSGFDWACYVLNDFAFNILEFSSLELLVIGHPCRLGGHTLGDRHDAHVSHEGAFVMVLEHLIS